MANIGTNTSSSSLGNFKIPYELVKHVAYRVPVLCSSGEAGAIVDSGFPGEGDNYKEIVRNTLLELEEKIGETPNYLRRLENQAECLALLSFAEELRKRIASKSAKEILEDIRLNPRRYESAPPKQAKDIAIVPKGANPIAAALCPDEEYGCSDSDLQPFDSLPLERRRLLSGCATLIRERALPPSSFTLAERKLIFPMSIFGLIGTSMTFVLNLATGVITGKIGARGANPLEAAESEKLEAADFSPASLMEILGERIGKDLGARLSGTVKRATAALESEFGSDTEPSRAFLAVLARALAHLNFEERLRRDDVENNVLDLKDDENTDPVWNADAKESKSPGPEPVILVSNIPLKDVAIPGAIMICGFDAVMINCIKKGASLVKKVLIAAQESAPSVVEEKWGRKVLRLLESMTAYRDIARLLHCSELAMFSVARGAAGKEDLPYEVKAECPQSPDSKTSSQNERK